MKIRTLASGKGKLLFFILPLFLFSVSCTKMLRKKREVREKIIAQTIKDVSKEVAAALYSEDPSVLKSYLDIYMEGNVFKTWSQVNCKGECINNWIQKVTIVHQSLRKTEKNKKVNFVFQNPKFKEDKDGLVYKTATLSVRDFEDKKTLDLGILKIDYTLD
jgi:hypothetical protein